MITPDLYPSPRYEIIDAKPFLFFFEKKTYRLLETIVYTCPITGETITCEKGETSDGATGAIDVHGGGWWPHDKACKRKTWDSGKPITAKQAAGILYHTHKAKGNHVRSYTWPTMTFLFGCKKVRENGWW